MAERRSIVVTYRQGFKYWLYGILLLVTVASLMAGMFWERSKVSEILAEKNQLARRVSTLESLVKSKETELEMVRVNNEVDSVALENARQEMMRLQGQTHQDQEQLQLYRELLEDTNPPSGLSVSRFQLTWIDSTNIAYRWVARQKTAKMEASTILADIRVMGIQGDKSVSLSLAELDTEVKKMPLAVKFKYFSINQGILKLPEGFEPEQVRVALRYTWMDKTQSDQKFDWEIEE